MSDLPASLVVFLVALPLSLGIALASGAPLMSGVIAAIVGGIVVGILGGAPLQVSGPAAGLTVIVYGYVQQYGWQATCAITVMAGVIQLILGALGIAPVTLAMYPAVIHGMLAAIGILIAISQMHVVFGHEPVGKGIKNLLYLPQSVGSLEAGATMLGVLTLAILVGWSFIPSARLRNIPRALVAVVVTTLVAVVFSVHAPRVSLGGSLMDALALPVLPAGGFTAILMAAVALAVVASAESLLCAVATDKLHSGPRANLHRELMAQGVANSLSGLIGGLPVTGVIVRSTANISAGAKTRLSPFLHGVWILLFVTTLGGLIAMIPLAALGALLVYTGFRLVDPKHIRELYRHGELPIYLVTVGAILATNLLEGLAIGFIVALIRVGWKLTHVDIHVTRDKNLWNITIEGTLAFAGVPKLMSKLATVPPGADAEVDLSVRFIDHAGYEALESWKQTHERMGGRVQIDRLEEIWHRSSRNLKGQEVEVPAPGSPGDTRDRLPGVPAHCSPPEPGLQGLTGILDARY